MKYFTKYLPEEGEIKAGDMAFSSEGKLREVTSTVLLKLRGSTNEFKGDKLAKLFLCSRDIQIGDEIRNDKGEKAICRDLGNDNVWFDMGEDHGLYSGQRHWSKIVGEVSPEAVWVKEGMEFDEEDISLRGCLQDLCLIKCPTCKTFH